MIVNHNVLYLHGKELFEITQIRPPLKDYNYLGSEACYLHILEGGHKQYSATQLILAEPDCGILMKCGKFIFEPVADKNSGIAKLVAIHFFPDVLKKLYKDNPPKILLSDGNDPDGNMAYINSNEVVSNYIESISLLFDNPKLAEESIIELKLKEIILILSKIDSKRINQILNNLFNPTTVVFKDVIEAHLYSALSVEDLASLTNNSLTSFKRKFKEIYQTSPANYIKNKRLENAAKLLKISDESISDISYKSAFNDLAHFSNSFKAKFNQSPSDYRLAQNSKL